jgi:Domain of unknown function (DUF5916)/Carbohydrate family 9 binding domain-like
MTDRIEGMRRGQRAGACALLAIGWWVASGSAQTIADAAGAPHAGSSHAVLQAFAHRIEGGAPTIDGRLDEPIWQTATPLSRFVQFKPDPGEPATAATEARILLDDNAIYIGIRMHDSPDSVAAQLTRRDATAAFTDWAHVLIDSYHDRRTAFRFSITPRGAKKDVLLFNDGEEDVNWDAVWDGAAHTDEQGWSAELRIPLSQLRFARVEGEAMVWGINVGREIARRGESDWWSPVLPTVGGVVSQAGELSLPAVEPPRRIEVIPYTLGRLTASPPDPGNPFRSARAQAMSVGGDVRVGIGSNLTLSATINPDFGQVEADPSVVNLSAFETFYPEKRPFFTEGSNIFSFKIGTDDNSGEGLFYSRRIGRAPQRSVQPDSGWSEIPDVTTIAAATKLSGRLSNGWTIGVIDALTSREMASLAKPGRPQWREAVEPRTNYGVASLSRDFRGGRSTLGFLATTVHRDLADGTLSFLRSSANTLGTNGRHRFADDQWEASGYLAGSTIRGSAESIERVQRAPGHYYQRPDADYLDFDPARTSLTGAIANVWVGRIAGTGHWRPGFGMHIRTPGFEVNDIGYQQQADEALVFANLQYRQFKPRGPFRSFSMGLNPSAGWDFGGERTWSQIGSSSNFELNSLWNGGFWIARRFPALSIGSLRGGPAVRWPGSFKYSIWLNSDRRHAVTGALNAFGGIEDETGSWDLTLSPTLTYRPSGRLDLSLGPRLARTRNAWQYIAQPDGPAGTQYLVGQLDQTTVSLTARAALTIRPTLSFELYAQPFISGGSYSAFRTLGQARADDFDHRFVLVARHALDYDQAAGRYAIDTNADGTFETTFANPDFNFRQMRGNAVLRWEYRPGSTLFVVWGQSRTSYIQSPTGDAFDLGRDTGRLFNRDRDFLTPVTNIFIIKLSYWLNP